MQPFVTYTTHSATSFAVNTESTYDWETEHWSVPIIFGVLQIFKLGRLPIQIGCKVATTPTDLPGPDWGFRVRSCSVPQVK
jgi:hypothetical protein